MRLEYRKRLAATFVWGVLCAAMTPVAASDDTPPAPHDGSYYLAAMRSSILEVIAENQGLFNRASDGSVKSPLLTPEAIHQRSAEVFREVAGEDLAPAFAGRDPERIANSLGNLLQAGRVVIALSQDLINTEADGSVVLKKFIPAVFGRLVANNFTGRTGVTLKQTSLGIGSFGPRNPYNAPDAWEAAALARLAAAGGEANTSIGAVVGDTYRLLRPIPIQAACQNCHGEPAGEPDPYGKPKEGYAIGDLRGAISVTLRLDSGD